MVTINNVPPASEGAAAATCNELTAAQAELTASISTALTITEALRHVLGNEAYAARTEPVVIDVVGWAFHWMPREVAGHGDTSLTLDAFEWDEELQRSTRFFWGAQIGDALRRMLPLVESVTVRGFGPEAPAVPPTPLRDDGWLSLELIPGVYTALSEPAPSLTLLENPGLHDDLWPSDGGCVSDKGKLVVTSEAELERRLRVGDTAGLGLGCLWRPTIELLVASGRLVWVTNYQSHEQLAAIGNLRGIGAEIVFAQPNGFREESQQALSASLDLLHPPGALAESLRDPYPRQYSIQEAEYATTSAIWRYRVEVGGFERTPHMARNCHVLAFRGPSQERPRPESRESKQAVYGAYEQLWRSNNRAEALRGRLVAQEIDPEAAAERARGFALADAARHAEASAAFETALAISPTDAESLRGLGKSRSELDQHSKAVAAYRAALKLRPSDASLWLSLGVAMSPMEEADDEQVLSAFHRAVDVGGPRDARSALTLARYLTKLSRPSEAIDAFYLAAGRDAEYFEEVKLGVGTARGQQGRLREALADFEAAARLSPTNAKLKQALGGMERNAAAVEAATAGVEDAVADVCGTPCQEVVDGSGLTVCAITWAMGCGEVPPPPGYTAQSTVAELCGRACAVYVWQKKAAGA